MESYARTARDSWRAIAAAVLIFSTVAAPSLCRALPAFNRQTGQNCMACHAGGQFPELTPYGRLFKLTGYTIGERNAIPLSAMVLLSDSKVSNTSCAAGGVFEIVMGTCAEAD